MVQKSLTIIAAYAIPVASSGYGYANFIAGRLVTAVDTGRSCAKGSQVTSVHTWQAMNFARVSNKK